MSEDIRESLNNIHWARQPNKQEDNQGIDALIPQEGRKQGNYHVPQDSLRYIQKTVKMSKSEDPLVPKLEYERKVLNKLKKPNEKCKIRRNNIFFLKVHKSGSATVQNILLRFVPVPVPVPV